MCEGSPTPKKKKKKTISNMKTKYGSYDLRIFVFIA